MVTYLEPLTKTANQILFAWKPEQGGAAVTYNMYVGLTPTPSTLVQLYDKIAPYPSKNPRSLGKVAYTADIADVQAVLGLNAVMDFTNTVFYFTITYVDSTNTESNIDLSTVVKVNTVGIQPPYMKDDPSINRHMYVFCDDLPDIGQRWVKAAGSSNGAVIVDTADYFKANITTVYTYDGTDLATTKSYPSDSTTPGSPAKLTTYTFSGGVVTKIAVTDSTV